MADRIDRDDHGDLDDVVIEDVEMFRMEWMDSGCVWLRCYRKDKPDVIFWLKSKRKIVGQHEIEDADDC